MEFRVLRTSLAALALGMVCHALIGAQATAAERPPNFIVVFVDNLGYGDIGPFGSKQHRTPRLDEMAEEGLALTHFYATSGVCTPSRASLMTGCYPRRVNLHEDASGGRVLRPIAARGLRPEEITIAEVLGKAGYATGIFGKWHLGDQPEFLPTRQGFDTFFGIPYSDDMAHTHPRARELGWPPLPLLRDETVIEAPVDRNTLVRRCTEEAIAFIRRNRDRPFFVYLPHAMPGSTSAPFASEAFRGRSKNGPYGDSVEELDWSAGQVLDALKELGLDEQTLVVWTSDNGAPRRDPPQGSNAPMGGWGYTTAEGGTRVPCLARWPGRIAAGSRCHELVTTMDLLPTLAALAGTEPPRDRPLDGHDVRSLLFGEGGGPVALRGLLLLRRPASTSSAFRALEAPPAPGPIAPTSRCGRRARPPRPLRCRPGPRRNARSRGDASDNRPDARSARRSGPRGPRRWRSIGGEPASGRSGRRPTTLDEELMVPGESAGIGRPVAVNNNSSLNQLHRNFSLI